MCTKLKDKIYNANLIYFSEIYPKMFNWILISFGETIFVAISLILGPSLSATGAKARSLKITLTALYLTVLLSKYSNYGVSLDEDSHFLGRQVGRLLPSLQNYSPRRFHLKFSVRVFGLSHY
jgi:hypothetical protein